MIGGAINDTKIDTCVMIVVSCECLLRNEANCPVQRDGNQLRVLSFCTMSAHFPTTDRSWSDAMLRFRFAGQCTLLIACIGWVGWFFPFDDLLDRSGTPLGGDFIMLKVAGEVVADGAVESLYDDQQNQLRSSEMIAGLDPQESWPYRYPPTVAACMAPLAGLPFAMSFAIFFSMQCALLVISLTALYQQSSLLRRYSGWLWAIAGAPIVVEVLVGGQSSLLALACLLVAVRLLLRYQTGYDALAGGVLALALYKPNVLGLLIVGLLVYRPRILLGFLPVAICGVLIAVQTCGYRCLLEYVQLGSQLASSQWSLETPFWKVHGLAPFFQYALPLHGKLLCAVVGLACSLALAWGLRRRKLSLAGGVSLLLVCNSLFNPYVPIYDLVLLIVALVLACEAPEFAHGWLCPTWLRTEWLLQGLAAGLFVGPHLSQLVAPSLGWQPFPLGLLALLLWGLIQAYQAACSPELRLSATNSVSCPLVQ